MTDRQKFKLYLPAWQAVVRLHAWRMDRATHRLAGQRRDLWGGPETTQLYQRVWQAAETIARGACRAVRPDDLRHGVHIAALGRDKSSTDFRDYELDRVLAALALLADADDMDAMLVWMNPQASERRRREWWLAHRCHPAYVARVAADMFGVADWRALDDRQLGILYGRVKHRPGATLERRADATARHRTRTAAPAPAADPADEFLALAAELSAELAG